MKTMKSMLRRSGAGLIGLAACAALPGMAQAAVNLPDPNCGVGSTDNNCLVFDDFTVYSLGLLDHYQKNFNLFVGYDFTYKPNEAVVNVIDGAGQGTTAQGGAGDDIDDPFRGMNGGSGGTASDNMLFLMAGDSITTGNGTIPSDPVQNPVGTWDNRISDSEAVVNSDTFTHQPRLGTLGSQFDGGVDSNCFKDMNNAGCMQSWDASVAAINDALDGDSLVFMFNNNETGDAGTLDGQDLLAWARVTLHNGDPTNANNAVFTLSGNPAKTILPQQRQAQTTDVDDILTSANDYWAYVHSEICVQSGTGAVYLGECEDSGFGASGVTVNQSLGADQAGFAVYSKELNTALSSGRFLYMTVDVRFSHLNNGADNLWIMGAEIDEPPPPPVPEPATLGLIGAGLLSLAGLRRRRQGDRRV